MDVTIGAWVAFGFLALVLVLVGLVLGILTDTKGGPIVGTIIGIFLSLIILCGMFWYYNNTASGQRALVDQKSELNNGIERVINVYTANGDLIATYQGKIDIDTNDGGYIKFDFEGKRYIYYNCFVETIAEID